MLPQNNAINARLPLLVFMFTITNLHVNKKYQLV